MHYNLDKPAQNVVQLLCARNLTLTAAESCTGGLLSGAVTSVGGASQIFSLGIVAYANEIKEQILGVKTETLETYGAVSAQCAAEMAQGARKLADSDIGISVTGIAGPTGGTPEKPVGTVYFACVYKDKTNILHIKTDSTDRGFIRNESVRQALILILNTLE
jgi:PncC family amidohydrolase